LSRSGNSNSDAVIIINADAVPGTIVTFYARMPSGSISLKYEFIVGEETGISVPFRIQSNTQGFGNAHFIAPPEMIDDPGDFDLEAPVFHGSLSFSRVPLAFIPEDFIAYIEPYDLFGEGEFGVFTDPISLNTFLVRIDPLTREPIVGRFDFEAGEFIPGNYRIISNAPSGEESAPSFTPGFGAAPEATYPASLVEPYEVVIEDEDVPLTNFDEVILEEDDTPLTSFEDFEIEDDDVPLVDFKTVEILEQTVPLSQMPATGIGDASGFLTSGIILLAITAAVVSRSIRKIKRALHEEDEQ